MKSKNLKFSPNNSDIKNVIILVTLKKGVCNEKQKSFGNGRFNGRFC